MLTGICIPGVEHQPIDPKVFDKMEEKQVRIARVEVTPGVSDQEIANVVDQFSSRFDVDPNFLIGAGKTGTNNYPDPSAPDGERRYEPRDVAETAVRILRRVREWPTLESQCSFEGLNEGDIGSMLYKALPQDYAECARQICASLRAEEFQGPILAGSVSNLNKRGLKYLASMGWEKLDPSILVNIHWYPDNKGTADAGHDGMTVEQEWQALLKIVGTQRQIAVTEFGFASMSGHLTQEQQAEETRKRLQFFKSKGCWCAISYQLNDGPNKKDFYDNLGWWTYPDRHPKPVQDVFAEFA